MTRADPFIQARLGYNVWMHPRHWLFIVSAGLFVSGLGLVIAAERTRRLADPPAPVVQAAEPVATIKQIMNGVVAPAAFVVWNSVGSSSTAGGIEERAPRTDAEWAQVSTSAAVLVESANLLLQGSRAVDRGEWLKMARAMAAAGRKALDAANARNAEAVFAVGEEITLTCDACHAAYSRG